MGKPVKEEKNTLGKNQYKLRRKPVTGKINKTANQNL